MIRPLNTIRRWWAHGPEATPDNGHSSRLPADDGAAPSNGGSAGSGAPARPTESPWLPQLDKAGIPRTLVYPTTTLGRLVDQAAERFGDATAVVYGATRWTYKQLLAQVNRTAGGLSSLGIRRGDRVLFTLPNCPEMIACFLAVQKLGAVVVNAGPLMGADDLAAVMTMTAPRAAIGLDLHAPVLHRAGAGSAVEHWVWVSLQAYQPVLKRLGYQYKLWHGRNGGDRSQHVNLDDLLANAPARPPTVEPDPSKVAVLQATGGTTGTLKLAQLTHRSLLANAAQISTWMGSRQGQDRFFSVLPMFHVYGLTTCMIAPLYMAAEMAVMTRFNGPDALDIIRRERPTVLPLVPAMCAGLCDEIEKQEKKDGRKAPPMDYVRLCITGAAPMPPAAMDRFFKLTGTPIIEGYGLTEASPVTHVNLLGKPRPGSIGLPMPDTRVRVVEVAEDGDLPAAAGSSNGHKNGNGNGNGHAAAGKLKDVKPGEAGEMLIAGPQVMLGYFSNPQQTAQVLHTDEHGVTWLHTGDIVRIDDEGFFYVLDRKKDMIIRGGLKIFPQKVETVLRRHSRVTDVAVVGRADAVRTETVVAVVVVTERIPVGSEKGATQQNREEFREMDRKNLTIELKALCREHLAPYEVPSHFEFVKELPRSPLGKLLKRELRKGPVEEPVREVPATVAAHEVVPQRRASDAKPVGTNGNGNGNGNGHDAKPASGLKSDNGSAPAKEVA